MARGAPAELGTERIAPNGYHYVKMEREGHTQWVLKHWVVMEEHLGRPLAPDERVRFKTGKRDDLTIDNLELLKRGGPNLKKKLAQLKTRRVELDAQIEDLEGKIADGE
jgi:hypothetical protein